MKSADLRKPSPDFTHLRNVLTGKALPDRLPFIDLFADRQIKELILGRAVAPDHSFDPDEIRRHIDDEIEFRYTLGYDYIDVSPLVYYGTNYQTSPTSDRFWVSESSSRIKTREDFEQHMWPDLERIDYWQVEYAASRLPDGMMIIPRISGIFENVCWLTGLEGLSYLFVDDPDLVADLFNTIGEIVLAVTTRLVEMDGVGAFFMGEDLGFRTGTLVSPTRLRQYVFPWLKKISEMVHTRNIPFLLHSCGNIEKIMDDLIETVGIDARHSFEDAVTPIEQAVTNYGNRIALLGGVDMDLLVRGTEEEVRRRVREIIESCAPSGRFALGTGNSIASYLNCNNYLAMLDEARRY